MNPQQASILARHLMDMHGLQSWQFKFDRAKRRFGSCCAKQKLITLSRPLTQLNDSAEVTDTILHEIAHALVPGGHTQRWREMCLKIGAAPRRCFNPASVMLPHITRSYRYTASCFCPTQHIRRRKPKAAYICRRCKKPLKWTRENLQPRPLIQTVSCI